ncbi:ribosome maturation factor RimP [Aciduricibacillus chroicocephali]|uniref:Ribosome maturation factor RimP n=1 Tax=Aciduricibacillus chroicocephali TaxID=3054939 RepID=A0ABY9KYJ4_9BACI|nr:ribosome maturation factor RimP [Bacillaceae bacterium 44XB]
MSSEAVKITEELARPIVESLSLELVDVEYVKEGSNWFLRVYIDKEGGVEIDECGLVSEKLSAKLDELDPIKDAYFLEVSSPGAERPLKTKADIANHVGSYVNIKLYEKIDGDKEFEGTIKSFENDILTLEYKVKTRKKELSVPYDKIAKARLAIAF